MSRFKIKRGRGQQRVEGKDFRLSDEVRYIQRHAAGRDARIVTVGPLLLFSTETGDAWMLDPADQLAAPLAPDGEPLCVQIKDTAANYAVTWQGSYRINGAAFVYQDNDSGSVRAILGYPTRTITDRISKMLG